MGEDGSDVKQMLRDFADIRVTQQAAAEELEAKVELEEGGAGICPVHLDRFASRKYGEDEHDWEYWRSGGGDQKEDFCAE